MDKKPKKAAVKPVAKDEEFDILVCARTHNNPNVTKGSIWKPCDECGASIWISLSGQRALRQNPKMMPVCLQCASKKQPDFGKTEIKAAPGSLQELRNYLRDRKKH